MNDDELFLKALNLSYFYLQFRARTKKEMTDYLNKKAQKFSFEPETIQKAIKALEDEGLIDDKKFIEWFVEIKNVRKPKSKYLMKQQLFKHGVDKQTVDDYFEDKVVDELALAKVALEKRWDKYNKLDKQGRFKKVASFLGRRGFSYDIIKKTLKSFEN